MEIAFRNIVSMYCIMMAAYVLKKKAPYPVDMVNNLVFNFFLPVTIFYSALEIQKPSLLGFAKLALSAFVVLVLTYFLTRMIARPFKLEESSKRTFLLGATYGNHAFLGLPVAYAFLGDMGVVLAIFYLFGGYFFLYMVGFYIMTGKITVTAVLKNPLIIAFVSGVLCIILRVELPSFLSHALELMNNATFPLSMVVVGGGLSLSFLFKPKNIMYTFMASFIKLALSPTIAYFIGMALSLTTDQLAICMLQSAMPAAVLVTIFSVKYRGDDLLSNSIVSLTTLASIGTIPLIIFFLK